MMREGEAGWEELDRQEEEERWQEEAQTEGDGMEVRESEGGENSDRINPRGRDWSLVAGSAEGEVPG